MPPERLSDLDIALINLRCAEGLPGAENLDIGECLATADRWAALVKSETERCLPLFYRDPAQFRYIEGFYRVQMLITVLKKTLGVDYNEARLNGEAPEKFFANSQDLFLNGLLSSPHTGTCASLPVLFVAIGRRLGYPLTLVSTKSHLFARWESADGKERFNIEGTNGGMSSHSDEYYTKGIYAWSGAAYDGEGFLQSMTPQQELAGFLSQRALCLRLDQRFAEARAAYEVCTALQPDSRILALKLAKARREEQFSKSQVTTNR